MEEEEAGVFSADDEDDLCTTEDTLASMSNSMSDSSRCTPPLTNASRRCLLPAQQRRVRRFLSDDAGSPSEASSTSMRTLRSPREHSFKAASINTAASGATAMLSSALLPSSCIGCPPEEEAEVVAVTGEQEPKRPKREVISQLPVISARQFFLTRFTSAGPHRKLSLQKKDLNEMDLI